MDTERCRVDRPGVALGYSVAIGYDHVDPTTNFGPETTSMS